jgi:hypothetical protein
MTDALLPHRPDRSPEVASMPPIKIVQHPAFRGHGRTRDRMLDSSAPTMALHLRVVSLDGRPGQADHGSGATC